MEITGCLFPPEFALWKKREDVPPLEKPEIGKEQASEVLFRQKCRVLLSINPYKIHHSGLILIS
jgi:hypothetical protein